LVYITLPFEETSGAALRGTTGMSYLEMIHIRNYLRKVKIFDRILTFSIVKPRIIITIIICHIPILSAFGVRIFVVAAAIQECFPRKSPKAAVFVRRYLRLLRRHILSRSEDFRNECWHKVALQPQATMEHRKDVVSTPSGSFQTFGLYPQSWTGIKQ